MRTDIAAAVKATGRTCGSCSMCCKLPPVPELDKPENQWCRHCRPGKPVPCTIYQSRPDICREFFCQWLIDDRSFGPEWKPSISKIVVRSFESEFGDGAIAQFMVDPATPHRWRQEPYYSTIKRVALGGLTAPPDYSYATYVSTGLGEAAGNFLTLPETDFEVRYLGEPILVSSVGNPRRWQAQRFDSWEQLQAFVDQHDSELIGLGLPPSLNIGRLT